MADKVTMKQFSEKLGEYENGSAARKAIGRFNGWSDEEKNKARKMIDAKFGPIETAKAKPVKKAAVKAPAKAPVAKVVAKGKPAVKAPAVKTPAVKVPAAPRAPRDSLKAASPKGQPVGFELAPDMQDVALSTIRDLTAAAANPMFDATNNKRFIAERAIHVCAVSAQTAHTIHGDQPSLDLTAAWTKIIDTQNHALDLFSKELDGVELVEEKVTARRSRKPAEAKSNDVKEVSSDDAAFAAPLPTTPVQI